MMYYESSNADSIKKLLNQYGIQINCSKSEADIPHSFWGAPEAGRKKNRLYIRGDTPIHSILHESCHYVCMSDAQRTLEQIDAKGTTMEENATCYLQILLADHIQGYSRSQLMKDMDAWGYSFRLGSAHAWFTQDARDVCVWLQKHQIISKNNQITWALRQQ